MILLGSRIMHLKGVIAERRKGWQDGFPADVESLLSDRPLGDDELVWEVIERFRLHPVEIDVSVNQGEGFQLAADFPNTEQIFSFMRPISYTGSQILWKQMPYQGYRTDLRVKTSATGDVYFSGYCTKASQNRVDDHLGYGREMLASLHKLMAPRIDRYNMDLAACVDRYVVTNKEDIARMRNEMHP